MHHTVSRFRYFPALKSGFMKVKEKTFVYHVDFMRDVFFLDLNVFYEYFTGDQEKRYVKTISKVYPDGRKSFCNRKQHGGI